jgi:CRISPR-associated protein Cas1
MVAAKIANCRQVLQRSLRDHLSGEGARAVESAVRHLATRLRGLAAEQSLDAVRGIEGDSARAYFGVFDWLITAQKDDFSFRGRSRRPPLDNMNALLSFLYSLLEHDVRSALSAVGLDAAVGFLHQDRPGRPGLSLDVMEEFRPFIAERLALSLVNLRQVQVSGFTRTESGAVSMDDDTRKTVIVAYQKRKAEELTHPFLGETVSIGMLAHLQARLLARYLRGDIDAYPPFLAR